MTDQEIVELINSSLAKEFELDQDTLSPETTLFEEMGLDSLDIVDLVIVLEAAFTFKIREEEAIRKKRTLGDIHTFVINKKRENENRA